MSAKNRTLTNLKAKVNAWNAQHPVGTPVFYRNDDGQIINTTTRSEAAVLSGHSAVIWLHGLPGCVALDRVRWAPSITSTAITPQASP